MVSRLGSLALAAIGGASLAVLSLATLGTGFLTVVPTLVGQAFGANQPRRCIHLAWQGLWSALAIGVAILLFYPAAPYIFTMLGHSEAVTHMEITYFRISLVALLPQLVALCLMNYFLAIQQPRIVLIAAASAVTLNVGFNYALIFGKFGAPALGLAGAAWGTLLSSAIQLLLILVFFFFQKDAKKFGAFRPTLSVPDIRQLWRVGGPAGIQDAVDWGTLGILLVFLVGKFGDAHLAATSLLFRFMQLALLPADGLGIVLMSLVANAIGAGKKDQAIAISRIGFMIILSYMTFMSIAFFILRVPIVGLFTNDSEVFTIAVQAMVCVCLFQLFDALNVTYIHTLQGAGDSAWPSVVNFLLSAVVMLGGGLLVIHYIPTVGSFGIWGLAALLTGLQGGAFWARWHFGPWQSIDLRNIPAPILTADVSELWNSELLNIGRIYRSESQLRSETSRWEDASLPTKTNKDRVKKPV